MLKRSGVILMHVVGIYVFCSNIIEIFIMGWKQIWTFHGLWNMKMSGFEG
jgi:hypothetical protein